MDSERRDIQFRDYSPMVCLCQRWKGLAPEVDNFVCRLGKFSIEVRLRPSPVETRDRPLNANAKVFTQTRGTKEPKDGKSRLENSTRKGEVREIHEYKRKLSMMQAQVKEIQDTLDGKDGLDPCDFNWTPPSVSKDTLRGLRVHIRHIRRKKVEMCKLLESVPQVVSEDKETGKLKEDFESKTEKFDEGKRGGAEPEISEAQLNRKVSWMPQCSAEEEPSKETLERVSRIREEEGWTTTEWSIGRRMLKDDEPHVDDLKRFQMSKEDGFEFKRTAACVNAFGIGYEEKMRKCRNAFRDGCKGRDISEMGCVMEENFVVSGILIGVHY